MTHLYTDNLTLTLTLALAVAVAVVIARILEEIRGYGHVQERHLKAARPKWGGLMAQWRAGAPIQRQVA